MTYLIYIEPEGCYLRLHGEVVELASLELARLLVIQLWRMSPYALQLFSIVPIKKP